nr:hypothetical protein [Bradyrhizobium retamae]
MAQAEVDLHWTSNEYGLAMLRWLKPQGFGRLTDKPAKHEANARMRSQIAHSIFDVQESPQAIGLTGIEDFRNPLDAE